MRGHCWPRYEIRETNRKGSVDVRLYPVLRREDNNILYTCKVSYLDAILGTTMKVPTVDGMVDLKIPAGTQPGTTLVMEKKGVPILNNKKARGDQLVKVQVEIPKQVSGEEKKLTEELASLKEKASVKVNTFDVCVASKTLELELKTSLRSI